jgi:hypothetical protein
MALLNFPPNPNIGDTYTIGSNTWEWTGTAWIKYTSGTNTPIAVNTSTASTSTNTGALVVNGGIGIGGSVNAGSTSTVNGAEIITTATLYKFATLQRVTDAGNSTTNVVVILSTASSTSTTTGALLVQGGVGVGGNVWVGGSINAKTTSTVNGAEIITTATINQYAPIPTLQSVTDVGNSTTNVVYITNTTESTSTNTGALLVEGGVGVGGDVWVEGRVTSESVKIMDAVFDSTAVSVNTTATTVIDQYFISEFRGAKYMVQIDEGTGLTANFEIIEIFMLVDNEGTVYATEYGLLTSNGELGDFSAGYDPLDSSVKLYFTPFFATDKNIKVLRTGLAN